MTEEKKVKKPSARKEAKASKETKTEKVSKAEFYDVILSPIITEKATAASEFNKIVFKVRDCATKTQVKQAIEGLFGVKVLSVNTNNTKGKNKLFRGKPGRRSGYKKAIVTIPAGEKIDVMAGV